jgi:hypothetical protein
MSTGLSLATRKIEIFDDTLEGPRQEMGEYNCDACEVEGDELGLPRVR